MFSKQYTGFNKLLEKIDHICKTVCVTGAVPEDFPQVCSSGEISTVQKYVEAGMNVNGKHSSGKTPLQIAIENLNNHWDKDIMEYLISKGANVNDAAVLNSAMKPSCCADTIIAILIASKVNLDLLQTATEEYNDESYGAYGYSSGYSSGYSYAIDAIKQHRHAESLSEQKSQEQYQEEETQSFCP